MALKNQITRVEVDCLSSNMSKLIYYPETEKLLITFKGENVYEYDDVENGRFVDMICAESIGKFFHANIKGRYGCRKLENDPEDDGFEESHDTALYGGGFNDSKKVTRRK